MSRKRASHEGILDECWLNCRPISVRKVGTSGTKGVVDGIGGCGREECKQRREQIDDAKDGKSLIYDCRTIIIASIAN